jgi:predicted acylesterase/phospholipase RssA
MGRDAITNARTARHARFTRAILGHKMHGVDAIVFSGSACRLAFGAGVAAAFADAGRALPLAAGASSGSLVAAAVAAHRGSDRSSRGVASCRTARRST